MFSDIAQDDTKFDESVAKVVDASAETEMSASVVFLMGSLLALGDVVPDESLVLDDS